jgi:uncharacterized membrane-anchored protein YjiN (DUF445 family)
MQIDKLNCRLWQLTVQATAFSALSVALLLGAGTAEAAMYRWVDGNGRVHYSDTLPQTYQQSGADVMNKQGSVIKRNQSEAERKAEAELKAEASRVQREQQAQAQLDRALMSTYTSEAEIDLARDRALEHHMLAIKGAETRAKAVDANLAELNERVGRLEKSGRPISDNLKEQLDQAVNESLELKRHILKNEEAMVQVREKYAADKERFKVLSGNQP